MNLAFRHLNRPQLKVTNLAYYQVGQITRQMASTSALPNSSEGAIGGPIESIMRSKLTEGFASHQFLHLVRIVEESIKICGHHIICYHIIMIRLPCLFNFCLVTASHISRLVILNCRT